MKNTFLLKVSDNVKEFYVNHSTFHRGDSGLDLFIAEDLSILPNTTSIVDLQVSCQCLGSLSLCPKNWFSGKFRKNISYYLFPRSSISKTPLVLHNSIGLIDSSYTGNLMVALRNTSNTTYSIKRGQRLVQLVNADLSSINFQLIEKHRKTSRASGGFGSTGQ